MYPLFYWLTGRGYRTTPMPVQLEAFKMAEVAQMDPRGLGLSMGIAFLLGGFFSFWSAIHLTYQHGNTPLIGHNWGQWNELAAWVGNDRPPDWQGMSVIGVSLLATLGMAWMRTLFLWWPFHPAGYALAMNFGVEYFWTCVLIAWLIKLVILRYGGHKVYHKTVPFMFGVVIGEYCIGAFWSVMSVILQRPTYDFCPG